MVRPLHPSAPFLSFSLGIPFFNRELALSNSIRAGTIYSLIYHTSLETSLTNHLLSERHPYFGRKSNFFNQVFVKNSWAWTSVAYVTHLFTSPSNPRESRRSRLVVFLVATALWMLFTTWFFGPALGDRIIALSGGDCTIALPHSNIFSVERINELVPSGLKVGGKGAMEIGDQIYLPVPHTLCHGGSTISPSSHPELASLLSFVHTSSAESTSDLQSVAEAVLPRARWYKGHDISGHAFLLPLAAVLLAREIGPTWKAWWRDLSLAQPSGRRTVGYRRRVNQGAALLGTGLIGVWLWMLLMTGMYFHNPLEKLSGLALGFGAVWLVTSASSASSTEMPAQLSQPTALDAIEDENAARRGSVVDDGAILDDPVFDGTADSTLAPGVEKDRKTA